MSRATAAGILAMWSLLSCGGSSSPQAPSSSTPSGTLVWQDEFDGQGLPDASRWNNEVGLIRNNERQFYTERRSENARLEGGRLVIEARKEAFQGAAYTSASLTSRANWTYGRIEVRAKLPKGRGTWPAIWTLGTNIGQVGWPACGEIDIMENVGFEPLRIHGSVHTAAYNHTKGTQKTATIDIGNPSEDFRVYAMEWYRDRIDVFADGQKYFTFRNEGTGSQVWPFDAAQYLLINLAIGGSWGGQKGIDDSKFPARYVVDYVRVYRQK